MLDRTVSVITSTSFRRIFSPTRKIFSLGILSKNLSERRSVVMYGRKILNEICFSVLNVSIKPKTSSLSYFQND